MHTVVETPTYLRKAEALFGPKDLADIVVMIATDPECGDMMAGTGGFRKVRYGRGDSGKSGGVRIVYIYRSEEFPVFLITVFAKKDKANLTKDERNQLKKRADEIFETYRR
jgi:hypothetical protein